MIKSCVFSFAIILAHSAYGFIDENVLNQKLNNCSQLRLELFERDNANPLIEDLASLTIDKKKPNFHAILDYLDQKNYFDAQFTKEECADKKCNAHVFPIALTLKDLALADFFIQLIAGRTVFKLKENNPIGSSDTQKKMANLLFKIGSWAYTVHTDRFQRLFESNNDGSKVSNHLNRCLEAIIAGSYGLEAVNPFFKKLIDKSLIGERDAHLHKVEKDFKEVVSKKISHDENKIYIQKIMSPNGINHVAIYQIDVFSNQKPITYVVKAVVATMAVAGIIKTHKEKDFLSKIEKRLDPKEGLVFAEYVGYETVNNKDFLIFKKADGVLLTKFLRQSMEIDNDAFFKDHLRNIGFLMGKLHSTNYEIVDDNIIAMTHGDCHSGNLFYSYFKKQLTAIDYVTAQISDITKDLGIFIKRIATFLDNNYYKQLKTEAHTKDLYIKNIKIVVESIRDGYLSACDNEKWKTIVSKSIKKQFSTYLNDFGVNYGYPYTCY